MENIVITGTSKGIGRYLSEYYLAKGYKVFGCSRSESDLVHDNYVHFELDVADEKSVISMAKKIDRSIEGNLALINNAGIASMNHSFLTPLKTMQNIFATNVFGTFLFCREFGKIMAKRKFGRIVNFATVAAPLKLEGEAVYAASKAAVANLTQVLAKEYAPYNITCNAVGPTPVYTDLIKNVPKNKIEALLNSQAIHRLGEFDDISNVIDFFIDEKSTFVTGQVLYLGGVS
jgi:3-oxoacyl-[acyl-carrier protein] reductase